MPARSITDQQLLRVCALNGIRVFIGNRGARFERIADGPEQIRYLQSLFMRPNMLLPEEWLVRFLATFGLSWDDLDAS